MQNPLFTTNEYISADVMNTAMSGIASGFVNVFKSLAKPGLVYPSSITFATTGLTSIIRLPQPFGIVFGNGVFAHAHGTQTGTDTQNYSVSFSGVVPVSGSTTAYLLASQTTIQQNQYQVVGPPPGHPDYNPDFVAFTAYSATVDSIALTPSYTGPDNTTTFEVARYTMTAGASSVPAPNTNYQFRATAITAFETVACSGNFTVPVTGFGSVYNAVSGLTWTLPPASGANNLWYGFLNSVSSGVSIQVQGSDLMYGTVANPASGYTVTALPQGCYTELAAVSGNWQVVASSLFGLTVSGKTYIDSNFVKFTGGGSATLQTQGNVCTPVIPPSGNIPSVTVSSGGTEQAIPVSSGRSGFRCEPWAIPRSFRHSRQSTIPASNGTWQRFSTPIPM